MKHTLAIVLIFFILLSCSDDENNTVAPDTNDSTKISQQQDSTESDDSITITAADSIRRDISSNFITAYNTNVKYTGRFDSTYCAWWTGSSVKIKFKGTSLKVISKKTRNYYTVIIDDSVKTIQSTDTLTIAENLTDTIHYIELYKRTEALVGIMYVKGFIIEGDILPYDKEQDITIEFIGSSTTSGYGNEAIDENEDFTDSTENGYMTYAAITARNFNAEFTAICYSGKGISQNYGGGKDLLIGELYTRVKPSDKSSRWESSISIPNAFVINIGSNDFSKGIPDSTEFCVKYGELILKLKSINSDAYIFCLGSQMLNTNELVILKGYIDTIVENEIKNSTKIYFYQLKESNYNDGGYGADYHPNIVQHEINAEELTQFISLKTGWRIIH